jgi:hypothetical protein
MREVMRLIGEVDAESLSPQTQQALLTAFRDWRAPPAGGPLELSRNGVHACPAAELVNWIDDELWLVELEEPVEQHEGT